MPIETENIFGLEAERQWEGRGTAIDWTFISRWMMLLVCIKFTPSQICIMYNSHRRSVRIKSSSMTRSNNSPPLILKRRILLNRLTEWSSCPYNSMIRQMSPLVSKASYSWRRRGCWSAFMISISFRASIRSCSLWIWMNLAASKCFVDLSRHFFTSPNLPLETEQPCRVHRSMDWASTDLPRNSISSYSSPTHLFFRTVTTRGENGGSISTSRDRSMIHVDDTCAPLPSSRTTSWDLRWPCCCNASGLKRRKINR